MSMTSNSTHLRIEVRVSLLIEKTKTNLNKVCTFSNELDFGFDLPFAENDVNGMSVKELELEKLAINRMCLELKAKRHVRLLNFTRMHQWCSVQLFSFTVTRDV